LLVVTETLTHRLAEADNAGDTDGLEELEGDGEVDVDIVMEGVEEAAVDTLLDERGDTDRKVLPDLDVVCVFEFVAVADSAVDAEFETDIEREPATDAETVLVRDTVAVPLKTPLNEELVDGLDVPVMDGLSEDVDEAVSVNMMLPVVLDDGDVVTVRTDLLYVGDTDDVMVADDVTLTDDVALGSTLLDDDVDGDNEDVREDVTVDEVDLLMLDVAVPVGDAVLPADKEDARLRLGDADTDGDPDEVGETL
jgi:hypothetical protein